MSKGSKPRNCFSQRFRDNHDSIDWGRNKKVEMTKERWKALMDNLDLHLTKEEMKAGWHFCQCWDGLLIGPDMPESKHCHCEWI